MDEDAVHRISNAVGAALKRKPAQEAKLAGVLRALAPTTPRLHESLRSALRVLSKRGSLDRPLYVAAVRSLAELGDPLATECLSQVLSTDDAGGMASLSAACFVSDSALTPALERAATSRHPHVAFGAELARVARRQSDGRRVAAIAPKIKESHRISLCTELLVPLLGHPGLPTAVGPALGVLRSAERHLGRWLVFADVASKAGDHTPREQAIHNAAHGPGGACAAWSFVAWALSSDGAPPSARPTVELVSRLSDRPSADRDPTFLYRLAAARVTSAKPVRENMTKGSGLKTEAALRAAFYLSRDHGRDDLGRAIAQLATNSRREHMRGLAVAALYDSGAREQAVELATPLMTSRQLGTATWAALVRQATAEDGGRVITESNYRRIQFGWLE